MQTTRCLLRAIDALRARTVCRRTLPPRGTGLLTGVIPQAPSPAYLVVIVSIIRVYVRIIYGSWTVVRVGELYVDCPYRRRVAHTHRSRLT